MLENINLAVLGVIILFIILALVIGRYPSLIAGYEQGQLPEEDEKQLITDVRIVLMGTIISLIPMMLVEYFDFVNPSLATVVSVIIPIVLVGWLVYKYNSFL